MGQISCQKASAILDPTSGKISTILSTSETLSTSPIKKPSYLNLACCVNGYSNLTTYDSKLRQNINKSREVSPNRPITHTLHYTRGDGNYLVVPVSVPVNVNETKENNMMNMNSLISPEKKFFTSPKSPAEQMGKDVTDNVNKNYFASTKYFSASSTTTTTTSHVKEVVEIKSPKSFIQQRVERLYGPGALAQGFYSPKRSNSDSSNSILSERSQNSTNTVKQTKIFKTEYRNGVVAAVNKFEVENLAVDEERSLPVLRHLRPEFRAQLPILSPKRSIAKLSTEFASLSGNQSTMSSNSTAVNGDAVPREHGQQNFNKTSTALPNSKNVSSASNQPNSLINGVVSELFSVNLSEDSSVASNGHAKMENGLKNGITNGNHDTEKDGHYFLNVLKLERDRLIALAVIAEGYMAELSEVSYFYVCQFFMFTKSLSLFMVL